MRKRGQSREKPLRKGHLAFPQHHTDLLNCGEGKHSVDNSKKSFENGDSLHETKQHYLESSQGTDRKICGVNLVGVFKVLVLVTIVPPFLNYASLQKEFRSLRPPGELKSLPAGHKLFMNCSGRGLPLVIMDTPAGFSSDIWSLIRPQVAKFTRVCVYDRTGLGFSESRFGHAQNEQWDNSRSRGDDVVRKRMQPTVDNMADDLHFLVRTTSNDSAVILVGGGLGAVNARFYTRMYENVFGLVLVNSFHEDMFTQGTNDWTRFWYENFVPSLELQRVLAILGVTRLGLLTGFIKPEVLNTDRLSDDVKSRLKHLLCNPAHLTSGVSEHYYINESLTQLKILRKLKPFPENVSVELISSEKFSDRLMSSLNELWFKNQQQLISEVYPSSERTTVKGDFRNVYFDDAATVVKTVRKLVKKFRKSVKQAENI